MKELSDIHFAKAEKIVLVQDHLNTHSPASLDEALPPAEDRRLVERFEWHFTPQHGSWLGLAESELVVRNLILLFNINALAIGGRGGIRLGTPIELIGEII